MQPIVPAGVPRRLRAFRSWAAGFLADAPLFFIGVTVGVAILFRIAVGFLKEPEAQAEAAPPPAFAVPSSKLAKPVEAAPGAPAISAPASTSATGFLGDDPKKATKKHLPHPKANRPGGVR